MFRTALQIVVVVCGFLLVAAATISTLLFLPAAMVSFLCSLIGWQVGWLGAYGITVLGIVVLIILGAAAFNER